MYASSMPASHLRRHTHEVGSQISARGMGEKEPGGCAHVRLMETIRCRSDDVQASALGGASDACGHSAYSYRAIRLSTCSATPQLALSSCPSGGTQVTESLASASEETLYRARSCGTPDVALGGKQSTTSDRSTGSLASAAPDNASVTTRIGRLHGSVRPVALSRKALGLKWSGDHLPGKMRVAISASAVERVTRYATILLIGGWKLCTQSAT